MTVAFEKLLELPRSLLFRGAVICLDSAGELIACSGGYQQRVMGQPAPALLHLSPELLPDAGATILIHINSLLLSMGDVKTA